MVLDTHTLFWWVRDRSRLSSRAHEALAGLTADSPGIVSSMSFWELALKSAKPTAAPLVDVEDFWADASANEALEIAKVDVQTWLANVALKWSHGDPADRTIVALAKTRGLPLITADRKIRAFYPHTIW